MVLKVYVSLTSGNFEIKRKQDALRNLLTCKKIDFEEIDITDPSLDSDKQFMRQNAKPKEGQSVALPPQIFNDEEYLGDYDALQESNECDELYEFLKMAQAKTKSQAEITLAENAAEN